MREETESAEEMPKHWAEARIACIPSKRAPSGDAEGLPLVCIEAMLSGCALAATRHAGITECVKEGETGYLVDEGDAAGKGQACRVVIVWEDFLFSCASSLLKLVGQSIFYGHIFLLLALQVLRFERAFNLSNVNILGSLLHNLVSQLGESSISTCVRCLLDHADPLSTVAYVQRDGVGWD